LTNTEPKEKGQVPQGQGHLVRNEKVLCSNPKCAYINGGTNPRAIKQSVIDRVSPDSLGPNGELPPLQCYGCVQSNKYDRKDLTMAELKRQRKERKERRNSRTMTAETT
jgi:hypothetical protein